MENVKEVLENTDWKLFKKQKCYLNTLAMQVILDGKDDKLNSLWGVINFIDALQDAIVDDGLVLEKDMFNIDIDIT